MVLKPLKWKPISITAEEQNSSEEFIYKILFERRR